MKRKNEISIRHIRHITHMSNNYRNNTYSLHYVYSFISLAHIYGNFYYRRKFTTISLIKQI